MIARPSSVAEEAINQRFKDLLSELLPFSIPVAGPAVMVWDEGALRRLWCEDFAVRQFGSRFTLVYGPWRVEIKSVDGLWIIEELKLGVSKARVLRRGVMWKGQVNPVRCLND